MGMYVSLSALACLLVSFFMLAWKDRVSLKREPWAEFKAQLKKVKPIPRFIGSVFFVLCVALLCYNFLHLNLNYDYQSNSNKQLHSE